MAKRAINAGEPKDDVQEPKPKDDVQEPKPKDDVQEPKPKDDAQESKPKDHGPGPKGPEPKNDTHMGRLLILAQQIADSYEETRKKEKELAQENSIKPERLNKPLVRQTAMSDNLGSPTAEVMKSEGMNRLPDALPDAPSPGADPEAQAAARPMAARRR